MTSGFEPQSHRNRQVTKVVIQGLFTAIIAACASPPSQQSASESLTTRHSDNASQAASAEFQGVPMVYLVGTPSSGDLTPDAIATRTGAAITNDWDEASRAIEGQAYAVLMVDSGSYDVVDWEWIHPYYRSGMVIAAINTPLQVIASELHDAEYEDHPLTDWPGEYYSIISQAISGPPAAQTAIFEDPDYRPTGEDWLAIMHHGYESGADKPIVGTVSEPGNSEFFYRELTSELRNLKRTVERVDQ